MSALEHYRREVARRSRVVPYVVAQEPECQPEPTTPVIGDLRTMLGDYERLLVRDAISAAKENRREAARLLGISLRMLYYKIERLEL